MGVQIFVNFDNPSLTFRPGELITGNVTVNTSSQIVATGLTISFHGECNVHWTESEQRRNIPPTHIGHHNLHHNHQHAHHPPTLDNQPSIHNPHHHHHHHPHEHSTVSYTTKEYRNQETYFNSMIALPLGMNLETYSTGNAIELQAGFYATIPFSFQLPLSIPSSCKLAHGVVNYFAEASLKVKHSLLVFSMETSKTHKKDFFILGALDLPLINDVLTPVHMQRQKQFNKGLLCCCCVGGGEENQFTMDLRLAKRGFIPGEPIVFYLNFSNATDVTITGITAHLDQNINFVTFGKEKVSSTRLTTAVYNSQVVPKSDGSWNNQLRVPQNAYLTDLGGCRIIHVKYTFTVKASASFCRNCKIEVPITVGTVSSTPGNYY